MNYHQACARNNRGSPDHVDSIAVTPSDLRLADGGTYQIFTWRDLPLILPLCGGYITLPALATTRDAWHIAVDIAA
jgi:hypothetical protein